MNLCCSTIVKVSNFYWLPYNHWLEKQLRRKAIWFSLIGSACNEFILKMSVAFIKQETCHIFLLSCAHVVFSFFSSILFWLSWKNKLKQAYDFRKHRLCHPTLMTLLTACSHSSISSQTKKLMDMCRVPTVEIFVKATLLHNITLKNNKKENICTYLSLFFSILLTIGLKNGFSMLKLMLSRCVCVWRLSSKFTFHFLPSNWN